jgi:thiosulfate/3-mercaptopyruvate sulfurtransferase
MDSPLITPAQLAAALRSENPPVVLDLRWRFGGPPGIDEYRRGHVPGACYVDLDSELAGPPGDNGRHPLPDPAVVEAAFRRCGVREDRPVVVYDPEDATVAARAWWLLGYLGHPDVSVLDGGLRAWREAGLPVSTGVEPAPAPGDFTARPGGRPVVDDAGAAELARHGVLLDARTAERYRGETEPIDAVAGHIPGARSAPAWDNLDATTGRFLPADQLRARFAALGAVPGAAVGAYCGSGVTAAQEVLALEVAGIPAALYVGSWSRWITDPARPVATGADPG